MKLYKRDSLIYFEDGDEKFYVSQNNVDISLSPTGSNLADITLQRINSVKKITTAASEVLNYKDVSYGSTVEDVVFGVFSGQDTKSQDQTTDDVIVKFNQVQEDTTLAVAAAIDERTITLTSATGTAAGKYIVLFDPASERFTTYTQVGAAAGAVITLDGPIDFDYPIGTFVTISDTNMAVDGSSTPQIFGLRGTGAPPGVDINFHMTRIMVSCLCTSIVNLSLFANITALTNGLVFRSRNGRYHNSFNVKSNREIDAIFGTDWKAYAALNPQQGQDGFTARLTFGGQEKIGVVKSLPIGEDYEIIVQDDLTTGTPNITLLEVWAEGHITEEP